MPHDELRGVDRDDLGAVGLAAGLDVLDQRHADVAVGRAQDPQRDLDIVLNPLALELRGGRVVDRDVDRLDAFVAGGDRVVESLEHGLVDLADQDDRVVALCTEAGGGICLDLGVDVAVVAVYAEHQRVEDRHDHEDQPGAVGELGHGDDHEHGEGHERAEAVDHQIGAHLSAFELARALAQQPSPVPDHAGLAEGEGDEDTDDVELDQRGDVRVVDHQDHDRGRGEGDDAVRVDEAVAAGGQGLRRVAVGGEHRAEQRESVEGGVRREQQHRGRRSLDDEEGQGVVAEHRGGDLRDHAALRSGGAILESHQVAGVLDVVDTRDQGHRDEADEQDDRDAAHGDERLLRVLDLGAAEGLDTVADRLDTGEGGASARERPEQQQDDGGLCDRLTLDGEAGGLGDGGVAERGAEQSDADHDGDAADEEVGGHGEGFARLAHASEVRRGQQDDEDHGHLDPEAVEERQRRDDVVDARGDRHGHRHDVVHQQGGCDDQAGLLAQILAGDLVIAPATGVRLDQQAVGDDDHHHQQHDRRRDEGGEGQERQPADEQDQQELLRGVRHRGERVAGEDRKCQVLGEQLSLELVGGERVSDEPALGRPGLFARPGVVNHEG